MFFKTLHCCWIDFIFPRNNFSPHVCCGLAVFCSQSFISVLRALFSINHSFVSWVFVGVSWYLPIIHVLFRPLATSVQQEAERRTASAKSIAQSLRWERISVGKMIRWIYEGGASLVSAFQGWKMKTINWHPSSCSVNLVALKSSDTFSYLPWIMIWQQNCQIKQGHGSC
jgi:hypothetical protein